MIAHSPAPILAMAIVLAAASALHGEASTPYVKDVEFGCAEIGKRCAALIESKKIDWPAITAQFTKEAAAIESDSDHLVLLVRLLARLRDGHAGVEPLERGQNIAWPTTGPYAHEENLTGPGLFLCRSGKQILVKSVFGAAAQAGIEAGFEVIAIDGKPVETWLAQRIAKLSELQSFSTDQQAFYFATHWGLAAPVGTRREFTFRGKRGKKTDKTLVYAERTSFIPDGPVFMPEGVQSIGRQSYGKTKRGFGYIHLRDVPGEVTEQMDTMLASIGRVPGLILDFRANGGGGCDHDALLGRFVPSGESMQRQQAGPIASAGANPYGGNIVVIVDAGARSAGETASGMFRYDGRAYMIGESPTAGMSSQKETIELPSGLFALFVSIASNKGRFNDGRGLEGLGTIPHEIVPYEAKDLAEGIDTQIRRAEEILTRFPQKEVPYKPDRHGWK